jgi:hypothetical protein
MFGSEIEKGVPLGDDLALPEIEELPALHDFEEEPDEHQGDFVEGDLDQDDEEEA